MAKKRVAEECIIILYRHYWIISSSVIFCTSVLRVDLCANNCSVLPEGVWWTWLMASSSLRTVSGTYASCGGQPFFVPRTTAIFCSTPRSGIPTLVRSWTYRTGGFFILMVHLNWTCFPLESHSCEVCSYRRSEWDMFGSGDVFHYVILHESETGVELTLDKWYIELCKFSDWIDWIDWNDWIGSIVIIKIQSFSLFMSYDCRHLHRAFTPWGYRLCHDLERQCSNRSQFFNCSHCQ